MRRVWPLIGAAAVLALAWLASVHHHVAGWERHVAIWFNAAPDWVARILGPIMRLGTLLGAAIVALVAALVCGVRRGVLVLLSALLAYGLARWVKDIVDRGRPVEFIAHMHVREGNGIGLGFVSGHTAVAFAAATALAPALPRWGKVLAFTLAALVGVGRMVYGVHFPLDVVGGAALGVLCGSLVLLGDAVAHDRRHHAQPEDG